LQISNVFIDKEKEKERTEIEFRLLNLGKHKCN